jgi:selenocysteine-specific elongation factor
LPRVIVGTAGHIDHGKTSLVLALTGIDCDRWAEEKARGITIDIGFAHLTEGDLQIGFVDVPGHERFLHNALAGLGGIRIMLLVVAADEGVKPQTREHLAVCSLLGIPAGIVALTKADLVDPDLLELAQIEVEDLLADTPFARAVILPVSSTTGAGLPLLKEALFQAARQVGNAETAEEGSPGQTAVRPARLPIDRAFHLKGLGAVVTGTLASGTIRAGDTLEVLPRGGTARVRSIQVHGEPREAALAGERTSLQITGIPLEDLHRGLELLTPGAFLATTRLAARFTLLEGAPAALSGYVPVRLHLYASEAVGRMRPLGVETIEPGESGLVEIRLAVPVVAVRGDRFILRRPSPATTLGGGEILDPLWRRPRNIAGIAGIAGTAVASALAALPGDLRAILALWVAGAGERGAEAPELARRLGVAPLGVAAELAALATEGRLLEVPEGTGHGRRFVTPAAYQRLTERARRVLKEYFQKDRMALGMPKAEAVRRILRGRAADLADVYLGWLAAQKVLAVRGDQVTLPGRGSELTSEESKLAAAVLDRFQKAGLTPPGPTDLQTDLQTKPQILDGVVRHLVARGQLLRLPSGLVLAATAVADLRQSLLATSWERFSVADFKDRFGLSRKWAIPLLEHLDSTGVTKRAGDDRLVVRSSRQNPESAGSV